MIQRLATANSKNGSITKANGGSKKFIDYLVDGHVAFKMWQKNCNMFGFKVGDLNDKTISSAVEAITNALENNVNLARPPKVLMKQAMFLLPKELTDDEREKVVQNVLKVHATPDRKPMVVVYHKGSTTNPENEHLHVVYSIRKRGIGEVDYENKQRVYHDIRNAVYGTIESFGFKFLEHQKKAKININKRPYMRNYLRNLSRKGQRDLFFDPEHMEREFLPKITHEKARLDVIAFIDELRFRSANPPKIVDKYVPIDYAKTPFQRFFSRVEAQYPSQCKSSYFLLKTILPTVTSPEVRLKLMERIAEIDRVTAANKRRNDRRSRSIPGCFQLSSQKGTEQEVEVSAVQEFPTLNSQEQLSDIAVERFEESREVVSSTVVETVEEGGRDRVQSMSSVEERRVVKQPVIAVAFESSGGQENKRAPAAMYKAVMSEVERCGVDFSDVAFDEYSSDAHVKEYVREHLDELLVERELRQGVSKHSAKSAGKDRLQNIGKKDDRKAR